MRNKWTEQQKMKERNRIKIKYRIRKDKKGENKKPVCETGDERSAKHSFRTEKEIRSATAPKVATKPHEEIA